MKNVKSFVISIKESPLRTKYIMDHCKSNGLQPKLFDAINGQKLGLLPEFNNKLEFPDHNVKISYGGVGCALSHYTLWNLLKYLPDEEFFIMEDDCIFCPDFAKKFEEFYTKLPANWEMAYVGWIKYGKDIEPIHITEGVSVRIPSATHAYLVKKSALSKLIEALHPISSPIDLHIIEKALPELTYYVSEPSLIEQKSYMNFKDFDWLSSGYNWELDLYGVKRKLSREYGFSEGWYDLEREDRIWWRWSKPIFQLTVPANKKFVLKCNSGIENKLTLRSDGKIIDEYIIIPGENDIEVDTNGIDVVSSTNGLLLEGKLDFPFIPSKKDSKSNDTRELGIALTNIIISVNTMTKISLDISKIFHSPIV